MLFMLRKLNKKTTIILSVVLVLALVAVAAVIKNVIDKPKNILKILPDHVDLQIKDFVYTEVGQQNSKWEVKAQTAKYLKNQNLALFDQVQIKLTTAENKIYVMTGDKGQMLTDKKDIEIKGNVVIISESGDRFSTDYLKYSDAEKKFYTDASVIMENKRMKIKGIGLTLFMNTGELNLSSAVKAKIN
jgi:LPS export ABC transporter protein LptC